MWAVWEGLREQHERRRSEDCSSFGSRPYQCCVRDWLLVDGTAVGVGDLEGCDYFGALLALLTFLAVLLEIVVQL